MDLQQLESFVAVSRLGSLSKAATALDLLPSVLSRRIATLEQTCGGKLFMRTGRGMVLTELGDRLLPRAQATLAEWRSFEAAVHEHGSSISGEVCVGLVPSLAPLITPLLYRSLRQQHPGIRLSVLEGVSAQLDHWRSNDGVDFTILFRAGQVELPGEDRIGSAETYLVASRGDPVTVKGQVAFAELDGLPMVLAAAPNGLRADVEAEARLQSIALNVVLETSSIAVQTEMAARGCAYTIMAGYAAAQRLSAGLQVARIVDPGILRTIALGFASHRPASAATREVARHARRHVAEAFETFGLQVG